MKEKLKSNKGGRPLTISNKELLKLLLDFRKKYGKQKITYSLLEKETNIPRHIWRDRKDIKEKIEKFNSIDLGLNSVELLQYNLELLPNWENIIEENFDNKFALTKAANEYDDFVKELYKRVVENSKAKLTIKELEKELEKKNNDIQELEFLMNDYRNKYLSTIVDSESEGKRNEKGIIKNFLTYDKKEFDDEIDSIFSNVNNDA